MARRTATAIELRRKRLFSQPFSYPILFQYVFSHTGQGGRVSVSSSSLITFPHFVHLYKPFPGFSPVRYIILQFLKVKQLFPRSILVKGGELPIMIFHIGPDPSSQFSAASLVVRLPMMFM